MDVTVSYNRIITAANEINDPLKEFNIETMKSTGSCSVIFLCYKRRNVPEDTFQWAFKLVERNLRQFYETSGWGWNGDEKLKEMDDESAYYLILQKESGDKDWIGFSHFRFDMDNNLPVLYCYELQVEQTYQGKGFGSIMVDMLFKIAQLTKMQKIVVTVFNHNPLSLKFFRKNNFRKDVTCPAKNEKADYVILSKIIK